MYPRTYAQYTLLERLATGGMSEVDLARRSLDEAGYVRFLVVKRIKATHVEDEAFVRMFKDEARITSELRHTNIASVYDFGRVGDEYYLALEYVPGTDLRAVLSRLKHLRQRMPVRQALRVASDVLSALHYAHTRTDALGHAMQIVHRDVNPRNIMVSLSGEVKLIDFGVARATDRLERTQTDHFKGKIAYMAPEQVRGQDLDHRADIFALGLTLYEMLAGRSAFAGYDQTQILYRILQGDLPTLSVPREWGQPGRRLAQLVDKALELEPSDRYDDADTMRRAVEDVAKAFGGMPSSAELKIFLDELDPGLEERVRAKMRSWSGPLPEPSEVRAIAPPPPMDSSSTIDRNQVVSPTTSTSITTSAVVAAGVGTATLVLVGALAAAIVVAVAVVWWSISGPRQAGAPPVAVDGPHQAAPIGDASADADGEDAGPLRLGVINRDPDAPSAPASAVGRPSGPSRPATGASAGDVPAGDGTAADPEGDAADPSEPATGGEADDGSPASPDGGTEADGEGSATADAGTTAPAPPDPREVPDAADATPAPQPVAVDRGTLQVTAAKKGLVIYIDGKPTQHVTGESFSWPVGTITVGANGMSPTTVEVRKSMVKVVVLHP